MRFASLITSRIGAPVSRVEPLAHLPYPQELDIKNAALAEFWRGNRLDGVPETIMPAPRPRHYRFTTKRRVLVGGPRIALRLGESGEPVSMLDPSEHARIYAAVTRAANDPRNRDACRRLNWVIIRGTGDRLCLILNVGDIDGAIVRTMQHVARAATEVDSRITAVFIFHDPLRSPYYLDTGEAGAAVKIKRLFGPERIAVTYEGVRYRFPATVFSQVNHAMVPALLKAARDLLAPSGGQHLLDLYCGYGLFSRYLRQEYARITGIDVARAAVEAAREAEEGNPRARFLVCPIDGDSLPRVLPRRDEREEAVILDPPRQGCAPGVISLIAERRPAVALHLCCGVDEIPRQLDEWRSCGYRAARIVPLDLFAGTAGLEVAVALRPAGQPPK